MGHAAVTFIVPIRNDSGKSVRETLESLVAFRNQTCEEPDDCQIICAGETPDIVMLRDYASKNGLSPAETLYPTSEWPEMERESMMPDIAACLNAASARVIHDVVVLLAPGVRIEGASSTSALAGAINAVSHDANLLVISPPRNTAHASFGSAAFSRIALETKGISLPAADGIPVICEKKLLGGFKFSQTANQVEQDAHWLISSIGFHYQETHGLKWRMESWT